MMVSRRRKAPAERFNPLSCAQIAAIRKVPHFCNSHYASWDIDDILQSYAADFVEPLAGQDPEVANVADVGTGYGWLAIAFALSTEFKITAVDFDGARLEAAKKIADILGVRDRIEWVVASVDNLPFPNQFFDAVYCIEVIEHVSDRREVVRDLSRVTRRYLTVSTPNKACPIVFHDTCLPFCHWLHPRLRDGYARLFRRHHLQAGNLFWTPWRLISALPEFKRLSSVARCLLPNLRLTFRRVSD